MVPVPKWSPKKCTSLNGPVPKWSYTVFSTWIQNRGLDNIDDADTKLEINISQNLLIKGYMIFLTANGNNITHVGTLLK